MKKLNFYNNQKTVWNSIFKNIDYDDWDNFLNFVDINLIRIIKINELLKN